MSLVRSKQRVADHGEVFTPAWMVEAMLDLVKDETERIDARFLEPACGSGNFIVHGDALTMRAQGDQPISFADLAKHDIFAPTKTYPPMTVSELAAVLGITEPKGAGIA